MMGRTFAFRIKWQKEWRQGSVIEIKDSRDLVKKIQIAESSKSIPLEIGVESSKSTPVKIVVDSSRSTPLQIADSLALDDIVMVNYTNFLILKVNISISIYMFYPGTFSFLNSFSGTFFYI
jgi:hypothetical protein